MAFIQHRDVNLSHGMTTRGLETTVKVLHIVALFIYQKNFTRRHRQDSYTMGMLNSDKLMHTTEESYTQL